MIASYIVFFVVAVPVFAAVFTGIAYFLGIFVSSFRPQEGSVFTIYKGFLLITVIWFGVGFATAWLYYMPLSGWALHLMIYIMAMTAAYRYVFDADWPQAIVIGLVGGIVGRFALAFAVAGLKELGLKLS